MFAVGLEPDDPLGAVPDEVGLAPVVDGADVGAVPGMERHEVVTRSKPSCGSHVFKGITYVSRQSAEHVSP